MPGVPYELKEMVIGTVLPDLQRRAGMTAVIKSRTLRTWGSSESRLAELLAGRIALLDKVSNPTLAFLASGIEGIRVRITAKAPDPAAADSILAEEESRLREILGDLVFAVDGETMESVVIGLLRQQRLTLALAESVSGGLAAARLSAVPGATEVLRGAIVCTTPELTKVLNIAKEPLPSGAAAEAMALGVCRLFGADVGLAVSGVIDPESTGKLAGTVFLGLAIAGRATVQEIRLPADRERMRQFSVISLLNLLRLRLLGRNG